MKSPTLPGLALALLPGLLLAASVRPALADEAMARANNCMGCHAVQYKLVGPAFKSVAARYDGRKDMVDVLAKKIRQGGGGVWGPVPMPANSRVDEADAKALATWVLGLPH